MIKIYNKNLVTQTVITDYISAIWTKKFYDVGNFEMHLAVNNPHLSYLVEDSIIYNNGKYGVILYKQQTYNDVKILGCDLKGLMALRKVAGNKNGNVETVIKNYVADSTSGSRAFDLFSLKTNQNRGATINWAIDGLSMLDIELKKICEANNIGYDVTVESNLLKFDILQGTDRTNEVTFSVDFKNIGDFDYSKDLLNSVNTVYNDNNATITEHYISVFSGLNRKEGIAKETGTSDEINTKTNAYLVEKSAKENLSCEANNKLVYGVDYFLGDTVTLVVNVFGEILTTEKQITEVQEVYEKNNIRTIPTFGIVKENVIKKILRG
jgi:hypothetical protein